MYTARVSVKDHELLESICWPLTLRYNPVLNRRKKKQELTIKRSVNNYFWNWQLFLQSFKGSLYSQCWISITLKYSTNRNKISARPGICCLGWYQNKTLLVSCWGSDGAYSSLRKGPLNLQVLMPEIILSDYDICIFRYTLCTSSGSEKKFAKAWNDAFSSWGESFSPTVCIWSQVDQWLVTCFPWASANYIQLMLCRFFSLNHPIYEGVWGLHSFHHFPSHFSMGHELLLSEEDYSGNRRRFPLAKWQSGLFTLQYFCWLCWTFLSHPQVVWQCSIVRNTQNNNTSWYQNLLFIMFLFSFNRLLASQHCCYAAAEMARKWWRFKEISKKNYCSNQTHLFHDPLKPLFQHLFLEHSTRPLIWKLCITVPRKFIYCCVHFPHDSLLQLNLSACCASDGGFQWYSSTRAGQIISW